MNFQTPPHIAKYMIDMIPSWATTILEPSPGRGNIVNQLLLRARFQVTSPENFFELPPAYYDCVIMNPPFSEKNGFEVPPELNLKGLKLGYYFLNECLQRSNYVIALMPVFVITDSDVRNRYFKKYGLKSITLLPRKTFQYSRIQTCILEFNGGWIGTTTFRFYEEN